MKDNSAMSFSTRIYDFINSEKRRLLNEILYFSKNFFDAKDSWWF